MVLGLEVEGVLLADVAQGLVVLLAAGQQVSVGQVGQAQHSGAELHTQLLQLGCVLSHSGVQGDGLGLIGLDLSFDGGGVFAPLFHALLLAEELAVFLSKLILEIGLVSSLKSIVLILLIICYETCLNRCFTLLASKNCCDLLVNLLLGCCKLYLSISIGLVSVCDLLVKVCNFAIRLTCILCTVALCCVKSLECIGNSLVLCCVSLIKLNKLLYSDNATYITSSKGNSEKFFIEGHTLFTHGGMEWGVDFNASSINGCFGIIPYPMLDKEQGKYYSALSDVYTMFLVPGNATNLDKIGAVLELTASKSYETTTVAYFEVLLKSRVANDVNAMQMLDIIHDGLCYEFGFTYSAALGNPAQALRTLLASSSSANWSSYWASKGSNFQNKLDDMMKQYE